MPILVHELWRHREREIERGEGVQGRRPSSVVVGAGVADPLEASVLESFAGAIDSEEEVGAVASGWRCRCW
jgi:hypothetical protein